MNLTKSQLKKIEAYLDAKKLTQMDLRYEVLDHMAQGIEASMENYKLDFQEAFSQETKKWDSELRESTSVWMGLAWAGPKIVMRKCVKTVQLSYKTTLLLTVLTLGFFFLLSQFIDKNMIIVIITKTFSVGYLMCTAFLVYGYYRIKASGYDTSYGKIFRMHALGYSFTYVFLNPWVVEFLGTYQMHGNIWIKSFIPMLFLMYSYNFWNLYKLHFQTKKVNLA